MAWESFHDVKIGVYAICADELKEFIDRWLESMKGADAIWVLITKKDNPNYTYLCERAKEDEFKSKLTIQEQEIKPWRFDVARNESLRLVDADEVDALVCTDIDEVLIEDFWDDYRKAVFEHPNFDRIFYKYAWSHNEDGTPAHCFWYDKTHQSTGWKWQYPVHEALTKLEWKETSGQYFLDENKVYLHHYPDSSKSRGDYLSLLELRVKENSNDINGFYYLAREYGFYGKIEECLNTAFSLFVKLRAAFSRHQQLDDMGTEAPLCIMIGRCFEMLNMRHQAESWFQEAVNTDGGLREGYIRLAQRQVWNGKPEEAEKTLQLMEERGMRYHDWREDPIALAEWKLLQIRADIEMWRKNYREASKLMSEAIKYIQDDNTKARAKDEGFYSDYDFLQEVLI